MCGNAEAFSEPGLPRVFLVMIKLSVIVPTYNRNRKLQTTVETLSRQTFPADDYEIIVVDDGSTEPVKLPKNLHPNLPPDSVR